MKVVFTIKYTNNLISIFLDYITEGKIYNKSWELFNNMHIISTVYPY